MDRAETERLVELEALKYMVLRTYNMVVAMTGTDEQTLTDAERQGIKNLSLSPIEGLDAASSDHFSASFAEAVEELQASAREMRGSRRPKRT